MSVDRIVVCKSSASASSYLHMAVFGLADSSSANLQRRAAHAFSSEILSVLIGCHAQAKGCSHFQMARLVLVLAASCKNISAV